MSGGWLRGAKRLDSWAQQSRKQSHPVLQLACPGQWRCLRCRRCLTHGRSRPWHASICSAGAKFIPSFIPEASDKIDTEGINKFETAAHDTAVAQQHVRLAGCGASWMEAQCLCACCAHGLLIQLCCLLPAQVTYGLVLRPRPGEGAEGGEEARAQQEAQPPAAAGDRGDAAKLKCV